MELKVSITQKGKIFEGKGPEVVQAELEGAMYDAVMLLERGVKLKTPVGVFGAQGGLQSTIHGEVQGKGTPIVKGIVATQSPYGEVIEKGRRAGKAWPPEGTLLRWIEVKFGVSEKVAKRIEFPVRAKIGKKGFPGAHMFEKGWDENWPKIQRRFEKAGFNIERELSE